MNDIQKYDVMVIGGGPAGMAAALAAHETGVSTAIIERENRLGGILKQCIHDGFGLIRFKERLTGPEYAGIYRNEIINHNIPTYLNTFVYDVQSTNDGFILTLVNHDIGVFKSSTKSLIMATGCRERTDRQIFLHGSRPAGIFTAGLAQYFINIQGYLPTKKCLILGSGDVGLIMARRLTLEGAKVLGVYEIQPEPSGLSRNVAQCLYDYNIPLHLSETVTEIHGSDRVEGVTVCQVDEMMKPISGQHKRINCDSLILSVGLIPENEILQSLNVKIDAHSRGPLVDQENMTFTSGIFCCGNALHVNDLVDYVSENGEIAGTSAAHFAIQGESERKLIPITIDSSIGYVVPQMINLRGKETVKVYFRSKKSMRNVRLNIIDDEQEIYSRKYDSVRPPEIEKITLNIDSISESCRGLQMKLEVRS